MATWADQAAAFKKTTGGLTYDQYLHTYAPALGTQGAYSTYRTAVNDLIKFGVPTGADFSEAYDPWAHGGSPGKFVTGVDLSDLSQGAVDAALSRYVEAEGKVAGYTVLPKSAPRDDVLSSALYDIGVRNALYKDYTLLQNAFGNAQAAAGSAGVQTQALQNRMRDNMQKDLIRGKGAFFENLKENSEADVRIGSNVQSQRRPKKTSRSTNAATARSKVLVRAPGINI